MDFWSYEDGLSDTEESFDKILTINGVRMEVIWNILTGNADNEVSCLNHIHRKHLAIKTNARSLYIIYEIYMTYSIIWNLHVPCFFC